MTAPVLFEELEAAGGKRIGVATLSAEKTLNALSLDMVDLLTDRFQTWAKDDGIALVVLQAAGEKAFCAGGDLQNLYRSMREHHASAEHGDVTANRYAAEFFEREYRLDYLIHTYPKPVLCWGHGIVMGGGVGLMSGASHRIVTEQSRVAMPEISIGLYPDVGGSWLLARMPGNTGLFLALTGAQVRAADAVFVGLADYALQHADKAALFAHLQEQAWTGRPGDDNALLTRILRGFAGSAPIEPGPLQKHAEAINAACGSADIRRIAKAIAELGSADSWLAKAAATLAAGSPSSAVLAQALWQRAHGMELDDVFRMEYLASLHCAARHDFAEGIRALLIDKDGKPGWQPGTLEDALATVDGYFATPKWDWHPLADL